MPIARKSVVAALDLPHGHTLSLKDLAIKRPGTGIAPVDLAKLAGRKLKRAIHADQVIQW
mgnify:CR=1 FL=1